MRTRGAYLLVNFGGPRDLHEIEEFLIALLTDQEVLRTGFPPFLHRFLFRRVAKKRALKVAPDYALIGGRSPIYEDTEAVACAVAELLQEPVLTFHRYLPRTHRAFIRACSQLQCEEIRVVPLFPQFSYATTGSIARWFSQHLNAETVHKMQWVKSYSEHPAYVGAFQSCIRTFLEKNHLKEEETVLLFSAHGVPQKFISTGDVYERECQGSFARIGAAFPGALSLLSYQSQFGKEEWLRPYTNTFCCQVKSWGQGRQHVVFVPLSFTSDHIETLYEIEHLYLPLIRERGFQAWRCPALNRREEWVRAIEEIFRERDSVSNASLIRSKDLLRNLGSVDFGVLLSQISI